MSNWAALTASVVVIGGVVRFAAAENGMALEVAPKDHWDNLGVPVRRSHIYSQTVGHDTAGREVLYFGFSDSKVFVLALDPRTGRGKQLNLLGRGGQVWGLCAHSSGKAYASIGSGEIFVLDVAADHVGLLGRAPKGEDVVWELYEAADGNLYGGTYPHAKLARVNAQTGAIEDLGRMDPEQMYVRTIATKDKYVYCGCGVTKPSVWAYNIRTGEKTQILPDEARRGTGWGRASKRIDGHVYIYGNGDRHWRVTGLQLERVGKVAGLPALQLDDGAHVFADDQAGLNRQYLLVTRDGKRSTVPFDYTASGTPLWSLIEGPDGRIYGNTHTPITLFAFDPATGKTHVYGDPVEHAGQIYSWMWHKGRLHMAAYSKCTYTIWDPGRPWNFGTEAGNNPRRLGKTSRHVQRANAMMLAPDGQHVFVGGLPSYGRVGGALAIVDPDAPQFEVIERPVEPQSPWTLATTPDPTVIVIGTSTYGGSSTRQALKPGRVVFWDWQRRQKVGELTPWDDETVIGSLLRLGNELWVCSAPKGKIAVYNFAAGKIVHMADYGCGPGRMRLRESDGKIYASMAGRIVCIDPATRRHEIIGTYPDLHAAIAFTGKHLYAFAGTNLLRFRLE